jgi:hypothetical protein
MSGFIIGYSPILVKSETPTPQEIFSHRDTESIEILR